MPPSLAEIDDFLTDTSPDAYAKLIDRLLASPRYGEKMALLWLDLARFGDTSGFENDSSRQMWKRGARLRSSGHTFNSNMRFDDFTIQQLAGDLLPKASIEQKIASGFNRNSRFNEETGERRPIRTSSSSGAVQCGPHQYHGPGLGCGMTLGCAECHSHKYDPISHREYYQLFAYFTGIKEPHGTGLHNQPLPPILKFPSPEQNRKSMAKLENDQAALSKRIDEQLSKPYHDPLAGANDVITVLSKPADTTWFDDAPPPGARPGGAMAMGPKNRSQRRKHSMAAQGPNVAPALPFTGATKPLPINAGDKLFAYVYLDPKNPPKSIMLQYHDGTWEHRARIGAEDKCLMAGTPNGPQHFKAWGRCPPRASGRDLRVAAEMLNLLPESFP